ncbi:MAG: type II toxin-antitoxin system RelE/ParE family toxin [Verrucomicrobiota bacterium]
MIRVRVSSDALEDLNDGFIFYEFQDPGLGDYFLSQLRADIDGLKITAGIHRQPHRHLHRLFSRRFPYAIFYEFKDSEALVVAIVDCRRDPDWISSHLDR